MHARPPRADEVRHVRVALGGGEVEGGVKFFSIRPTNDQELVMESGEKKLRWLCNKGRVVYDVDKLDVAANVRDAVRATAAATLSELGMPADSKPPLGLVMWKNVEEFQDYAKTLRPAGMDSV